MIKTSFPDVLVAPLADMPTDQAWSQQLDSLVALTCPIGKVVLYGGRDSFIPHYKGKHPTYEIELAQAG
jgi:bifunctional NMN adenylyltransferase/nudix hydrolase